MKGRYFISIVLMALTVGHWVIDGVFKHEWAKIGPEVLVAVLCLALGLVIGFSPWLLRISRRGLFEAGKAWGRHER